VPDHRYPLMINGVPVVEASEEIDICNAEQLRIALLEASSHGHATVVVDMTPTRFCDSEGFSVLVGAHKRPWLKAAGCGWSSRLIPRSCGSSK
jgi:anti-anti-sigma factor